MAPFTNTILNPDWRPSSWVELDLAQRAWNTLVNSKAEEADNKSKAELNARWDADIAAMETEKILPTVANAEDEKDAGVQARRRLFKIAIEYGDKETGKILPLRKAAELMQKLDKAEGNAPVPGADAPVAGAGGAPTPPSNKPYDLIRGKRTDVIVAEARERGEI